MEDERQGQINVERAFERSGSLGAFQFLSFVFLFLPGLFHIARMTSVDFAVEYESPYRCAIPGWDNDTFEAGTFDHQVAVNESIPPDSTCRVYNPNRSFHYDHYHRPVGANRSGDLVSCPNGWVYDTSVIRNTAREKFNLVCSQKDFPSYVDMCVMIGSLIGSVLFGAISDRFGRKIGFLSAVPVCTAAGLAITWSPNYVALTILFAVAGAGCTGMFNCVYVLALESVLPKHRNVPGMLNQIFLPLGEIILAGLGYGFKDWFWMNIVISAPAILFVSYHWLLSESPLWLNAHGKLNEVLELFVRMARRNGRLGGLTACEYREQLTGLIESEERDDDAPAVQDSIRDMFTTSCFLCGRTLIMLLSWFAANYDYYGLILFTAHLSNDVYLSFFLGALVEIPAHVMSFFLVNRLGRKPVHCFYFLLVACSTACALGMKAGDVGHDDAVLALTLIGKFGAAGLMGTSFLWMVELYPVSVRSSGAGINNVAAKLGAIVVPFINRLGKDLHTPVGDAVPYMGFCAISVIAFLAVLTLPETANRALPNTVAEAEEFGRSRPHPLAQVAANNYGAIGGRRNDLGI